MPDRIRLLTLQTFSTTGGIQKMTRTLCYSLQQHAAAGQGEFSCWSLHDAQQTGMSQYIEPSQFKGFANARVKFVWQNIRAARNTDALIISHINLAVIGLLVKLMNPYCRVYLIAHGIEVWRPLSLVQKMLLSYCTHIWCVSTYTQKQLQQLHQVPLHKMRVLNNALDPYTHLPHGFNKPGYLLQRYRLNTQHQVVFTLTRLASTEQYKGYEQVISVIAKLSATYPHIRYVLAGQADDAEARRISELITAQGLQQQVIVTGYIKDTELEDHFLMADMFVLPSKKEGFGLVFIEALACGLPVISGNADGSTDALVNGELGLSVTPGNAAELEEGIIRYLECPPDTAARQILQQKCFSYFNEARYRQRLYNLLNEPATN